MDIDEIRALAAEQGYELRRKGRKQDHSAVKNSEGEQLRNCYLPHLAATASVRARTIKVLEEARSRIGAFAGDTEAQWCDIWEVLLLGLEHLMRNLKMKAFCGRKQLEFTVNTLAPLNDYMKVVKVCAETIENIPDWAASVLMYGDYSGLNEESKALVDCFIDKMANDGYLLASPIDGTENEFCLNPAFGDACSTRSWTAHTYRYRLQTREVK